MFKQRSGRMQNRQYNLPAPVKGLDAVNSLMLLRESQAVILENWFPEPDKLTTRPGFYSHCTGFANPVERLHVYSALNGGETLFATTDAGIYDANGSGAVGTVKIALTNGATISTAINTGANSYLMMVNGTDTLKQFDGSSWTSVATFGAIATSTFSYIELYRQRIFLITKNSMEIFYLAANSISGSGTAYPLGAVFRKGGYLVAMANWTIDGGAGPEDNLAIISSKGEVAVYNGNDPTTWTLRGVYYIGVPLGAKCMTPYGGDILVMTESGVIPLSSVVAGTATDKVQNFSQAVRPIFNAAAQSFSSQAGWEILVDPLTPQIIVNIPAIPLAKQAVMHSQTGAWTLYSGYNATCWARKGQELYFGTSNAVRRVGGISDNGENITATLSQAHSRLGLAGNKQIALVRAYLSATGGFTYNMGVANNFNDPREKTYHTGSVGTSVYLWGTAIWGTALWAGGEGVVQDWQTVPDEPSNWKSLYLQVVTNNGQISYLGSDLLILPTSGNF
jgi:hypothetical protein